MTVVQRHLVEQNTSLKKEVAIAERKLQARNERIGSLEALLEESQVKLGQANHKYVKPLCRDGPPTNVCARFETQLQAVRERLEAAKISSRGAPGQPGQNGGGAFSMNNVGARIAKPLIGGGGAHNGITNGAPGFPILSSLQSEANGAGKRTSWFFNNRG